MIAIALQIDTVHVGSSLYSDGPCRKAVAAVAANRTLFPRGQSLEATRSCVVKELETLHITAGLPVGWNSVTPPPSGDVGHWLLRLLGRGLTALAASFGAPFWFDAHHVTPTACSWAEASSPR